MADSNITTPIAKPSGYRSRASIVGPDYLNQHTLFGQDDESQTLRDDADNTPDEEVLIQRLRESIGKPIVKPSDRKVTFSTVLDTREDADTDDDDEEDEEATQNRLDRELLDKMDNIDTFVKLVQDQPKEAHDMITRICDDFHAAQLLHENDQEQLEILHLSNQKNLKRVSLYVKKWRDAQKEAIFLKEQNVANPGSSDRNRAQLADQKERSDYYKKKVGEERERNNILTQQVAAAKADLSEQYDE